MKFLKLTSDLEVEAVFSGLCLLMQEVVAQGGPKEHVDLINRLMNQLAVLNKTPTVKGLSLVPSAQVIPFATIPPKDLA